MNPHILDQRRRLLTWLAASPLLPYTRFVAGVEDKPSKLAALEAQAALIAKPEDAINVFDFEPVFFKNVPPAHAGYMASGIDNEVTLRANREAFGKYYLRPRRLNDVSKVDMSVELFGKKWETPIIVAPTGGNRAFHPEGEIAVAKGAKAQRVAQILSTVANTPVEQVIATRGEPVWFQLYATPSFAVAEAVVQRAERAGSPVLCVTVDRLGGRNQETSLRMRAADTRECKACHAGGVAGRLARMPHYQGTDAINQPNLQSANMTWDFVRRLRDRTKMKIVIKGILTAEDADLCVSNGFDGLIVSNHGARSEDSGRATIDVLPEVVEAVKGRITVLVDGGFRRGTDIVKALAMGANGIAVGRPYLWGLGAFGDAGVAKVLEILRTELRVAMQQCGTPNIKAITPAFVRKT